MSTGRTVIFFIGVMLFAWLVLRPDPPAPSSSEPDDSLEVLLKEPDFRQVWEVSPALALRGRDLGSRARYHCSVRDGDLLDVDEILSGLSMGANEKEQRWVEQAAEVVRRESAVLCEALSQVNSERDAVLGHVRESGVAPEDVYDFAFYERAGDGDDDRQYVETWAGPIRELERCDEIEALLRNAGIATRRCQPVDFAALDVLKELLR